MPIMPQSWRFASHKTISKSIAIFFIQYKNSNFGCFHGVVHLFLWTIVYVIVDVRKHLDNKEVVNKHVPIYWCTTCIYEYVCICVYIYVYVYMYMYMYMYMYIYICERDVGIRYVVQHHICNSTDPP